MTATGHRPVGRPRRGDEVKTRLDTRTLARIEQLTEAEGRDRSATIAALIRDGLHARDHAAAHTLAEQLAARAGITDPIAAAARALPVPEIADHPAIAELFAEACRELQAEDDNGIVRRVHATPENPRDAAWICASLAADRVATAYVHQRMRAAAVPDYDRDATRTARTLAAHVALEVVIAYLARLAENRLADWEIELLAADPAPAPASTVEEWVKTLYPVAHAALETQQASR